jgi:clan AA aspartic protease (TIGR02281 family)
MAAVIEGIIGIFEWETLANIALGFFLASWITHQAPNPAGRQVVIPVDGGHGCHTNLTVNGHVFRVLLDSGATGMPVVFGSNQADDLGIEGTLDYSHSYSSANGEGREAFTRLREITLSGWTMRDVPAVITKAPQDEGLLGAELLHRLNFAATDGYCTLTMPVEAQMTAEAAPPVRRPQHHRKPASRD